MANNKLKWQLPFLVLLIVGTILILNKQVPYQTDEGLVFGTIYKITYQSKDNLKSEIEKELKKVDFSLSPFNKESTITHINNNTDMSTDSLFLYVYNLARNVSEATYGAFDITVAPLVNAWGFGFKNAANVDSATIDSLRTFVGFDKVSLKNGKIVKQDERTMLDCSAIAKGFGVDCVARLLESKGIKNYMVDIGGELMIKGVNPKDETWRIGINKPIEDSLSVNQELQTVLEISNVGLATSGNYRNFYYKDGKKYAHHRPTHWISYTAQHIVVYRSCEQLRHCRCLRYLVHGIGPRLCQGDLCSTSRNERLFYIYHRQRKNGHLLYRRNEKVY